MRGGNNLIDLAGRQFGRLVVLRRGPYVGSDPGWLCRCAFGTEKLVRSSCLRRGSTRSCGCFRSELNSEAYSAKLQGQRFGKLLVFRRVKSTRDFNARWLCECDCGNYSILTTGALKHTTRSCGCAAKLPPGEAAKRALLRHYKCGAKQRGLDWSISDEEAFRMFSEDCSYCGAKPSRIVSHPEYNGRYISGGIDRTDNSKGYIPGNCVPCCGICNMAKREIPLSEFLEWVNRIHSFQQAKDKVAT